MISLVAQPMIAENEQQRIIRQMTRNVLQMTIQLEQSRMDGGMGRRRSVRLVGTVVRKERMDDKHIGSAVASQESLELLLDRFRVVMVHIERIDGIVRGRKDIPCQFSPNRIACVHDSNLGTPPDRPTASPFDGAGIANDPIVTRRRRTSGQAL